MFTGAVSGTGAEPLTGVKRHWSQPGPGVIYPKSATFPRQNQKVDDNLVCSVITTQAGSSLYYPGKLFGFLRKKFNRSLLQSIGRMLCTLLSPKSWSNKIFSTTTMLRSFIQSVGWRTDSIFRTLQTTLCALFVLSSLCLTRLSSFHRDSVFESGFDSRP